jgi:hypothetical protein
MKDKTRNIEVTETPQTKSQWGDSDIVREIKSQSNKQKKAPKTSKVVNDSKPRKVESKRTEKLSKERQSELIQKAKARVISNQKELETIKSKIEKQIDKVRKSFSDSVKKYRG